MKSLCPECDKPISDPYKCPCGWKFKEITPCAYEVCEEHATFRKGPSNFCRKHLEEVYRKVRKDYLLNKGLWADLQTFKREERIEYIRHLKKYCTEKMREINKNAVRG